MLHRVRGLVPWIALAALGAAIAWALHQQPLPPADLRFSNGTEIKSIDPAIVTGQPEGRVIRALFEGLVDWHPRDLHPVPAVAYRWEIEDADRRYIFHLRDDARWSDGSPVTTDDFLYSFRRFLDPMTGAEYAKVLYYVRNAERYNRADPQPGEPVEVELLDPDPSAPHARHPLVRGTLLAVDERPDARDESLTRRVFTVEVDGRVRRFTPHAELAGAGVERCRQVLPDFQLVGFHAPDERTLVIELEHPAPYFLQLMGFYPVFPVNRQCIERHGYPAWTRPENLVTNGPFILESRRVRDRIRMVRNPYYWDQENVHLDVIEAYAVESQTTALNMYMTGQLDWIPEVPVTIIPELLAQERDDFQPEPYLAIYYYRVNTTRPALQDPRVRRALSLALDRDELVATVTRAGEIPAERFVPPGLADYDAELERHAERARLATSVERARQLMADAGYPEGRGFPRLDLLFNTHQTHSQIAELVQSQWKEALGIDAQLVNKEWASYLSDQRRMDYDVARAGWIGDYADPNTFLNLFFSDNPQNQTGWAHSGFDERINAASRVVLTDDERRELEARVRELPEWTAERHGELLAEAIEATRRARRMELFFEAEEVLLDELPVIPIFVYVSKSMVRPYVEGIYRNIQDTHPYKGIRVDREARDALLRAGGLR